MKNAPGWCMKVVSELGSETKLTTTENVQADCALTAVSPTVPVARNVRNPGPAFHPLTASETVNECRLSVDAVVVPDPSGKSKSDTGVGIIDPPPTTG